MFDLSVNFENNLGRNCYGHVPITSWEVSYSYTLEDEQCKILLSNDLTTDYLLAIITDSPVLRQFESRAEEPVAGLHHTCIQADSKIKEFLDTDQRRMLLRIENRCLQLTPVTYTWFWNSFLLSVIMNEKLI